MVERDFIYTMQHPVKGCLTFTNDPDKAEAFSRAGWIVNAKSNTGNGSKVFSRALSGRYGEIDCTGGIVLNRSTGFSQEITEATCRESCCSTRR